MKQLSEIQDRNELRKVLRSTCDGLPWGRHPKGRIVTNCRNVDIAQFGELNPMKRDECHSAYVVAVVNDHVEADIDALLAIIAELSARVPTKPQQQASVRR